MAATNMPGDIIVGFFSGYLTTLLISYILSHRHGKPFDFIGASAIGLVVMSAIVNLAFIGTINAFSAGILLVGIQMLAFVPIVVIGLPLAVVSRRSTSDLTKTLAALGTLVTCGITVYLFSGACFSGACMYLSPGSVGGNPMTNRYQTEAWTTFSDSTEGFGIEYPPEMTVSEKTYPPNSIVSAAERVVEFTMNFSDNQPLGTPPITLDVNHNPNGAVEAQEVNLCGSFRVVACTSYAPPILVTIDGYPAVLNFLTDGTFHYLNADLKGMGESADFNVQLPFDAYDTRKPPKLEDDATVQDIFVRMIATFKFTTPFNPSITSPVVGPALGPGGLEPMACYKYFALNDLT